MPNIKSAKKRARLAIARHIANAAKRSALRTAVKRAHASLTGGVEEARTQFTVATKKLDRAVAAGIIHKNTAARRKSRLARKVNLLAQKS